jgi:hypothetical protein
MDCYADINDYVSLRFGDYKAITDGSLFELASDAVDALCYGRIRKVGFDNLTKFQQEKVKKAVCLHVSFLSTYGDLLNSPLSSYGINGVSMSFDAAKVVTQGNVTTNQAVMQQLRQSGLATRLIP